METTLKEILKKTKPVDKEHITIMMELNTLDSGRMINKKDWELKSG